jgi:predicted transcriptional regulator
VVRVIRSELDHAAYQWLVALIGLSRAERRGTLGEFCDRCGIQYRHLYQVISGKSAITQETLSALQTEAQRRGIADLIKLRILQEGLGIKP